MEGPTIHTMVGSREVFAPVDLDESALDEMCDGDAAFERELLDTFLSCQEEAMAHLEAAMGARDYEAIRKLAHFTKGGARSIGAKRLAMLAEGLECAMNRGCHDETGELVAEVESAYRRLKTIIQDRAAG